MYNAQDAEPEGVVERVKSVRILASNRKWRHLADKQPGIIAALLKTVEPTIFTDAWILANPDNMENAKLLVFALKKHLDSVMPHVADSTLAELDALKVAVLHRYAAVGKPLAGYVADSDKFKYFAIVNVDDVPHLAYVLPDGTQITMCLGKDVQHIAVADPMDFKSAISYTIVMGTKRMKRNMTNVHENLADEDNYAAPDFEGAITAPPSTIAAASPQDPASVPPAAIAGPAAAASGASASAGTPKANARRRTPSGSPTPGERSGSGSGSLISGVLRRRMEEASAK